MILEMNEAGVNLSFVRRVLEAQTGLALIFLNTKRENSIVIIGGANIFYKNVSILPEEYKSAIKSCKSFIYL
jgi:sugar/nucleoside kinase (ribokinase family)